MSGGPTRAGIDSPSSRDFVPGEGTCVRRSHETARSNETAITKGKTFLRVGILFSVTQVGSGFWRKQRHSFRNETPQAEACATSEPNSGIIVGGIYPSQISMTCRA